MFYSMPVNARKINSNSFYIFNDENKSIEVYKRKNSSIEFPFELVDELKAWKDTNNFINAFILDLDFSEDLVNEIVYFYIDHEI